MSCPHPLRQTTARPDFIHCWACGKTFRPDSPDGWMIMRRWDAIEKPLFVAPKAGRRP